MNIQVFDNHNELSLAAANIAVDAVNKKPNIVFGFPTGSTPIKMYEFIAKAYAEKRADFRAAKCFNLDEYIGLDKSNNQSYHYFMTQHLYSKTNFVPANTHVPCGTAADLVKAASDYEKSIADAGGIDVFFVGIGQNGHIGFNEPAAIMPAYTNVVNLTQSTINANSRLFEKASDVPTKAITMGMASIMHAKKIVLLANGASKADAIKKTVSGKITLDCPSTLLQLHSNVVLLLDKDAASGI